MMSEMSATPPSLAPRRHIVEPLLLVTGAAGAVCAAAGLTDISPTPTATALLVSGVALPFAALLSLSARMRHRERLARQRTDILDATSSDVVLIVANDRIVQAGGATLRLLGCSPDALVDGIAHDVLPFVDPADFERLLLRAHTDRPRPVVAENVHLQLHDGRTPTVDLVMHQPDDPSLRGTVVRLIDATDRHHLMQRLGNVGALDPVSGLANRERIIELGEAALHRAKRTGEHLAVLAIHLDGLQAINETFGAGIADEVVRASAARLASALRTEDLRGRHADDVFIAVAGGMAQDIGRSYAVDVADRITESLSAPIMFDGHELALRPWIGVAHRAQTSGNPGIEELLSEALLGMDEVRRATTRWSNLGS